MKRIGMATFEPAGPRHARLKPRALRGPARTIDQETVAALQWARDYVSDRDKENAYYRRVHSEIEEAAKAARPDASGPWAEIAAGIFLNLPEVYQLEVDMDGSVKVEFWDREQPPFLAYGAAGLAIVRAVADRIEEAMERRAEGRQ